MLTVGARTVVAVVEVSSTIAACASERHAPFRGEAVVVGEGEAVIAVGGALGCRAQSLIVHGGEGIDVYEAGDSVSSIER